MKALIALRELQVRGGGDGSQCVTVALEHLGGSHSKTGEAAWRRNHFLRILENGRKQGQGLVQKKMIRNDTDF